MVASLVMTPFVAMFWQTVSLEHLLAIACLGLLAAIGDICLLKAFSYTPASSLAPYAFSMVVFGSILSWAWFGDVPDNFTLLGAGIIIISGLVLLYKRKEQPSNDASDVSSLAQFVSQPSIDKNNLTENSHPALHYERMIGDQPRMDAYQRAISQNVKAGDIVADLGTGLGVLAIMSAQAGAKKVYAIDLNPNSIWMAKQIAEQNGVADKIEFISANAQELQLPEKVDVIVNELVGEFGNEEGIVETVSKFAKKKPLS